MNQRGFILPSPFLISLAAAGFLLLTTILFYNLWQGSKDELNNFKSSVETQTKLLRAEAERAKAQSEKLSAEANANWLAARDVKPRVIRVRPDNCSTGAVRTIPATTAKPDAAPIEQESSSTVNVARCEEIANSAIVDAAQLIHLQQWIKDQHEVKR